MTDAIYIHIPFCMNKCEYCDFLSFQCGRDKRKVYVDRLIDEIRLYEKYDYDTVYFGGGTPSLLDVVDIKRILDELRINQDAEVTLEVNPKSVDREKLKGFKEAGVNRVSIGVQSFNEKHLKTLGRLHSKDRAVETYNIAREVGFENISLDLMFSLPEQTEKELESDITTICKLSPDHISIYSLIWEEGTPFYEKLKKGELFETDNELEADMYEMIIDKLEESGYNHYEISNFAKDNMEARHNSKYWENVEYVGVGLGASGYLGNLRYKNKSDFDEYYEDIAAGIKPVDQGEIEVVKAREIEEYRIILGLRLLKVGIEKSEKHASTIDSLVDRGYLVEKENRYLLTRKGVFLANNVFEEFL